MKLPAALLGLAVLTMLGAADQLHVAPSARAEALELLATPLALNPENRGQTRIGALVYRGGLVLRSPSRDFGGISGLRLTADGRTMLAVSDTGSWISFQLVEKRGQLVGVRGMALSPILGLDGLPGVKKDRDAEALAIAPGGNVTVAFEGQNALWQFLEPDPAQLASLAAKPVRIETPPDMMAWPSNGGPEAYDTGSYAGSRGALYVAPKPQSLTLAEDAFDTANTTAGIIDFPTRRQFRYLPPLGFKPTDTQLISDVEALVLHRRFSPMTGVAASIGLVDLADVATKSNVAPRELARLEPPLSVDNMEGLTYVERAGPKTSVQRFIYIISDDNFSGLQRTLLMKFEWPPEKPAAR